MRRMVMVIAVVIAVAIAVGLPAVGLAAQEKPNKHERQLVAAELKEIGEGDLDGAMKAYAALHADADAPNAVRARAALNLARCERKRGRLAVAERLLAALVRDFAQEKQVVKTAQSFLRELRTGKPENPDFDWMGALEKNPEIQARVFKLAMDVAEPGGSQGVLARKQLQALGRVAVPMLLKLCATSREPVHRQVLATILVQAGSFERLAVLFGGAALAMDDDELPAMIEAVIRFEPEDKKRLLEAARAMKPHPEVVPWLATLRLAAGESVELADLLKTLEQYEAPSLGWSSLKWEPSRILAERARHEPAIERVLVQRLKDPKCEEMAADTYLEILRGRVFKHFALDQVTRLLIRVGSATDISSYAHEFFARWEKKKTYSPITAMARHKKLHAEITKYLVKRYDWEMKPETVPAGWAEVLRAAGRFNDLHRIAERNDGFIPVFEDFMHERAKIAPKFEGHRVFAKEGFHGPYRGPSDGIYKGWTPSAAFAAAMLRLLDVSDPVTQTLALEALACARAGVGPDAAARILRLVKETAGSDAPVANAAIAALCARFALRPDIGAQVIEAWLVWNRARQAASDAEAKETQAVIYAELRGVFFGQYDCRYLLRRHVPTLFRFAFARAETTLGCSLIASVEKRLRPEDTVSVLEHAFGLAQTPEQVRTLLGLRPETLRRFAATPVGKAALKRCALDQRLDPASRVAAVNLAWPDSEGWLDWNKVFIKDPALTERLMSYGRGFWDWFRRQAVDEQESLIVAAMRGTTPEMRAKLLGLAEVLGHRRLPLLQKALTDASPIVFAAAIKGITESQLAEEVRLLVPLLNDPRFVGMYRQDINVLVRAIDRLIEIAPREAIPLLVELLDQSDLRVRNVAKGGLRGIKKALDEKAEWKRLVEAMKKTGEKAVEKKE